MIPAPRRSARRPRPGPKRARPRGLTIEARAKLNLGLVVGPPRADGFHDLVTLFQSVSLADTLEIVPRAPGLSLAVRFENAAARGATVFDRAAVPRGRDNLVLRAARLWFERTGAPGGADFRLTKRIPAGAGLGGGSADAAAALAGLGRMHGIRLPRERALELAAALGSDVPFAVAGGTRLGRGRGERLRRVRLARAFTAVLAVPRWRVSTSRAFAEIDRHKNLLTPWGAKLRSAQLLGHKQLRAETWLRLGNTFENVLGKRVADFQSLRDRLLNAGAVEARMTGSGSGVFGVLEPGTSARDVIDRFEGSEALFVVRSRVAGLKLEPLR